jgi:hypothetical protein
MSLLDTGRSELLQANLLNKSATDIANARQAQKSSLEYQNDIANNNRNGAIAGSAVNLGIAYAGYKHDQAKANEQSPGIEKANPTSNSIANSDLFRSGTSGGAIDTSGLGGNGSVVGSDAGGQAFNQQVSGTAGSQGLAGSNASGSVVGSNAGGGTLNNSLSSGATPSTAQGSSGSAETTQSLNTDVSNSSTPSGESSGGGSSDGGGGAAGAVAIVGGLYQLFNSIF